jgi:hypothetical protein
VYLCVLREENIFVADFSQSIFSPGKQDVVRIDPPTAAVPGIPGGIKKQKIVANRERGIVVAATRFTNWRKRC